MSNLNGNLIVLKISMVKFKDFEKKENYEVLFNGI